MKKKLKRWLHLVVLYTKIVSFDPLLILSKETWPQQKISSVAALLTDALRLYKVITDSWQIAPFIDLLFLSLFCQAVFSVVLGFACLSIVVEAMLDFGY